MSDTNNVQVAEHLMEWLREKGANYQNIFINEKTSHQHTYTNEKVSIFNIFSNEKISAFYLPVMQKLKIIGRMIRNLLFSLPVANALKLNKRSDFLNILQFAKLAKIKAIENRLNNHPRKIFGYRIPLKVKSDLRCVVLRI